MERPTNHSPTLRPERRAFLIKGRPTNTSGVPLSVQMTATNHGANQPPHLVAAFPSSNSASIDSTTGSHQHYCSQCNNMISLSSSENNYNIVIAAGGLSDQNAFIRSTTTTNSSSSLQPTHSQTTSHLRQVRSLEKEYNPSICEEAQFVLPVPNISKIYGRSLDEILDKGKLQQQQHDLGKQSPMRTTTTALIGNLPITTTSILSTASSGKRTPLIKMKNVDMNLANVLPSANQVKSAPNSGESSPKGNLSFDSDVGDLAISDPGDYTNYQQQSQCSASADVGGNKEDADDRKTPVTRRYYLIAENPSIKSSCSLDEMNLDDPNRTAEPYKLANIPSFLIEEEVSNKSTDDEADKTDRQQSFDLSEKDDKNDLNNNLV